MKKILTFFLCFLTFNLYANVKDDIELTIECTSFSGYNIPNPHNYDNLHMEVNIIDQNGTFVNVFTKRIHEYLPENFGNSLGFSLNENLTLFVDRVTYVEINIFDLSNNNTETLLYKGGKEHDLTILEPSKKESHSISTFANYDPINAGPEVFTLEYEIIYEYKNVRNFSIKKYDSDNNAIGGELCVSDAFELSASVPANETDLIYEMEYIARDDNNNIIKSGNLPEGESYKSNVLDFLDLLGITDRRISYKITFSVLVRHIDFVTNKRFLNKELIINPASTDLTINKLEEFACVGGTALIEVVPEDKENQYDLFITEGEFSSEEIANYESKKLNGITIISLSSGSWKLTVALKNTEDNNNGRCYTSETVTINEYELPEASILPPNQNPLCQDSKGQITIKPSPGKEPIKYSIVRSDEPDEPDEPDDFKLNNVFPDLKAGTYKIKVKDACGIERETNTTLIAPKNVPVPTIEDKHKHNPTCRDNPNGNFIAKIDHPNDANFSYNYNYVLYKNNVEFNTVNTDQKQVAFNNLEGANYKVVIHDADRPTCPTAENSTSLAIVAPIQLTIDEKKDPTCFNAEDGLIRTEASGGNNDYNYFFGANTSNKTGDFNNLKAGKYEIYAKTTVNNCPDQSPIMEIELTNPPEINVSLDTTPMQCHNDNDASITANVTGGNGNFSYQWYFKSGSDWYPASTSASYQNLQSGEYKLEVSEASCTIESSAVQIVNPQPLTFATVDINRPACKGDQPASINPSASGGWGDYQYFTAANQPSNWQPFTPGSTIGDGTYYLQVEDKEGCTHLYENTIQFITPDEELVMDLATETQNGFHLSCFNSNDGSVNINGSGGVGSYLYAINNQDFISESTYDQLPAGKHTFKLKDENGCEKTRELTLTQPTQIILSILSQDDVKCFGEYSGTAELTANSGITPYQFRLDENEWQEQPVFNELTAQSYLVTIKDANDCEMTLPLEIQSIFDPIVIDFDVNHVSCFGYSDGSINTTLAGGMPPFSYDWQQGNDQSFLQDLPAGTYELEVADDEGCKATASVTVTEPENIDLGDPVTICQQQDYPLDVSQPDAVAYQWSGPGNFSSDQPVVNFTEAGTYQLTLTLDNGCEMTDDFILSYNDILFETNFLIASAAEVGDTVRLIEVCYPAPDSVNWRMDARANILQMDKHRPLISFDQPGEYPVAMAASYSGCIDSLTKTVTFYELGEMPAQGARMKLGVAGIRAIQVYPNPNQGAFTLELHLYQPDDVMFFLYDLSGNEITRIKRGGEVRYEEPVALGSYRPGIYILKAVAAGDEKNIRIMIN